MQIADALLVEGRGKLAFGEAGLARGRDRPGVDQKLDLGPFEFSQDRFGLCFLVADGEELWLGFGHRLTPSDSRSAPSQQPAHAPCPRGSHRRTRHAARPWAW